MSLTVFFQAMQLFLMQHHVLSPVVYVIVHILLAVCVIPCSPMAVIAGVLWGKWLGLVISMTAAFLSSCTTFFLSRLFLRKKIYQILLKRYPKTDWFLTQTKKQGWKFVALVQLNPAAPGSTLGYLFGLSDIDFFIYGFFLMVFMLPLQLILVICGDAFPTLLTGKILWIPASMMLLFAIYLIYGFKNERKSQ